MKILITTGPGLGHILPVLPLARELRARGHDLRWVVGPGSIDTVVDAGIEVIVAGMSEAERQSEFARRYPEVHSLPPRNRRTVSFSKVFGNIAAPPVVEVVRSLVQSWRPEVVVHDAAEFAAPLAAAAAGVPSVGHGFGEVIPEVAVRRTGEAMAPLWEEAGLAPDTYAGSYRGLYIDIYPPSLRGVGMDHVPHVQLCRPADGRPASGGVVYVTFGTLFNQVDDGFRAAMLAAAAVADEVLVTVGSGRNPDDVGPRPDNVRVEQFVPQAEVLPRCAAVVCHGGSGTVLAALAHGVPLLCLPRGADQFDNASNVTRVGAGTALYGAEATQPALQTALDRLLGSTAPRTAAMALAEEIAGMPSIVEVATAVEQHAVRQLA